MNALLLPALLLLTSLPALATPLADQGVLKGRIVDWPSGQTGELKLRSDVDGDHLGMVFATARVDPQGHFELKLPGSDQVTPTLALLKRLFANPSNWGRNECVGEGTAAPESGGFRNFELIAYVGGQEVGDVTLRSSAARWDNPGEVAGELWFLSQPVTLQGRVTCPNDIHDFDFTAASGWNLLPARNVSREDRLLRQYRGSTLPAGLQWRLYEEFGGTGMRFSLAPDGVGVVVDLVAPGMPAERAGLQPGDQIVAVDGQDLTNVPITRIVNWIAGPPNTKLVLDVRRDGQVRKVELTRALVRLP